MISDVLVLHLGDKEHFYILVLYEINDPLDVFNEDPFIPRLLHIEGNRLVRPYYMNSVVSRRFGDPVT